MNLLVLVISLLVICAALVVVAVDRTARATAWRRIAEERRWNADRQPLSRRPVR